MKTINYETSEFKLYMNMIYCEAGMHDKAIKLLEENRKTILDKEAMLESLGKKSIKGILFASISSNRCLYCDDLKRFE